MDTQPPSTAPFLALVVAEAIAATTPPHETPHDHGARAAFIADMLHAHDPADAMEASIACQCIILRYALLDAMRALRSAEDEKTRSRRQSALNGLSRTAHQWHTLYQATQARRLAAQTARDTVRDKATEDRTARDKAAQGTAPAQARPDTKPAPAAVQPPPASPGPRATMPPVATPPADAPRTLPPLPLDFPIMSPELMQSAAVLARMLVQQAGGTLDDGEDMREPRAA